VAIADGGCGVWECCGPGARIEFTEATVRWNIAYLDTYVFDRSAYETEIARLPTIVEEPYSPTDPNA
jgi:hypothetical protein